MADQGMTVHDLECSGHLKQARALGLSLAEYARAHGLKVRMLYDAGNRLKKKGVIAGALLSQGPAKGSPEGKSENGESQFVAVRVEVRASQYLHSCPCFGFSTRAAIYWSLVPGRLPM